MSLDLIIYKPLFLIETYDNKQYFLPMTLFDAFVSGMNANKFVPIMYEWKQKIIAVANIKEVWEATEEAMTKKNLMFPLSFDDRIDFENEIVIYTDQSKKQPNTKQLEWLLIYMYCKKKRLNVGTEWTTKMDEARRIYAEKGINEALNFIHNQK